jgi:hypothetical protein
LIDCGRRTLGGGGGGRFCSVAGVRVCVFRAFFLVSVSLSRLWPRSEVRSVFEYYYLCRPGGFFLFLENVLCARWCVVLIFFQISKLCFVVDWLCFFVFFLVDRSPFAFSRWFFLSPGVLACLCLFAFSKPVVWSSVDEVAV